MTKDNVDQSRAWDAYGHAMASIAGLEHLINVANFHDEASEVLSDKRNQTAKINELVKTATARHFSQSIDMFYDYHTELQSDEFRDALNNAISIRNTLTHKYFSSIWKFLYSEQGLDIIACECHFYREHFEGIEKHIRENGRCDFLRFYDQLEDTQNIMDNHPIHRFLIGEFTSIEEALLASNQGLKIDS